MSIIFPSNVSLVIQKEILRGLTFANPTGGLEIINPSPLTGEISGQIDQFLPRLPFKALDAAQLEQPTINYSNNDLFVNTGNNTTFFPNTDATLASVDMNFTTASDDAGYTRTMSTAAGLLEISSAGLGNEAIEMMLTEFRHGFQQILHRYLSVALIYGGYYPASGWFYYQTTATPEPDGWNQSLAFDGLHLITTPTFDGGLGSGFRAGALGFNIDLTSINSFIADFKGANNGQIDYLMMNSDLRREYINLWHNVGQVPQYVADPMTGKLCLAHDGIPILTNDYIMTFDPTGFSTVPYYISDIWNPENILGVSPAVKQTSMYALCVGEKNNGIFGFYPRAFGDGTSPVKIERQMTSQTKDTILLKGTVQAGLGFCTRRSVGRMPGIVIP